MLRIESKVNNLKSVCPGFTTIDITHSSKSKIYNHYGKEFCPMTGNIIVHDSGNTFHQFDNWWNGNKVYKHLNHAIKKGSKWYTTKHFEKFQNTWAMSKKYIKPIERKYLFGVYDGEKCNKKDARIMYTVKYYESIQLTGVYTSLLRYYLTGNNILLIGENGPDVKLYPNGIDVTMELIENVHNNIDIPYDPVYVLGLMLLESKDPGVNNLCKLI